MISSHNSQKLKLVFFFNLCALTTTTKYVAKCTLYKHNSLQYFIHQIIIMKCSVLTWWIVPYDIIMHPPDACMCSVDSRHRNRRRGRSPHIVNAISTEPLVRIIRNVIWSRFSDFHKNDGYFVCVLNIVSAWMSRTASSNHS